MSQTKPKPKPKAKAKAKETLDLTIASELTELTEVTEVTELTEVTDFKSISTSDPTTVPTTVLNDRRIVRLKRRSCLPEKTINFIERHKPLARYQLLLTNQDYVKLNTWFSQIESTGNYNNGLFLTGAPGCAKTITARTFCESYGYTVREFNAFDCRNKKIVDTVILKMLENIPIDSIMNTSIKYAIIIDELECMADKSSLNTLIKIINSKKRSNLRLAIPLIFISAETTDKKINELRRHCTEVKFADPTSDMILKLFNRVLTREHLIIDDTKNLELINDIVISNSDCDYRRLLNYLQYIITQIKNDKKYKSDMTGDGDGDGDGDGEPSLLKSKYRTIDYDTFKCQSLIFQTKYSDVNIYQNCAKLFTQPSIAKSIRIYENNKSLLPMMVHENYSYLTASVFQTKKEQLKRCLKNINYIIQGDLIDKVMYNTQSWHYANIHCLNSCYLPAYTSVVTPTEAAASAVVLANDKSKTKPGLKSKALPIAAQKLESSIETRVIKYTTTLGKHSLQSSNKKKFLAVLSNIGNGKTYSTSDLYYLGNIIRFNALNSKGDINVVKDYMRTYNLTFEIIDKIIRFSHFGDVTNYTVKQKNTLKTQLQGVKILKPIHIGIDFDDD